MKSHVLGFADALPGLRALLLTAQRRALQRSAAFAAGVEAQTVEGYA